MTILENNVFLTSIKEYAYVNSSWFDLSSYVIGDVTGRNLGISSNDPTDRMARVGFVTITLNNYSGKFLPGDSTALTGWKKGIPLVIDMVFEGITYRRFRGYIDKITPNDNIDIRTVTITVTNFLKFIENYPVETPAIQLNKTGDVAISTMVGGIHQQPQSTNYDVGSFSYPALFDTVTTDTSAASEINKVVSSEGGYFYEIADKEFGETLRFENARARNGLRTLKVLPESLIESDYVCDENGNKLTDENGNRLKYSALCDCILGETATFIRSYGDNVINRFVVTSYPKEIDTTNQVLYTLDTPQLVGSGQTITFKGKYTNPNKTGKVNAVSSSMSITTKTANTAIDGSGTDLSANFTVTGVFGTEAPDFTVTNNSGYAGYLTVLTASGLGVYQNSTISYTAESEASQNDNGVEEKRLFQQYQRDLSNGRAIADNVIDFEKDPRTRIEKIKMIANYSSENMLAFLNVNSGDLIAFYNSTFEIDSYCYIQGIEEFRISQDGTISFTWVVQESFSLQKGLTGIAVECHSSTNEAISFGNLTQLIDLPKMTLTAWIYPTAYQDGIMGGYVTGAGGFVFAVESVARKKLQFIQPYATGGNWEGTTEITLNAWSLVSVSIDVDVKLPVFHLNGSVDATVTNTAATGSVKSWNGFNFCLGNYYATDAQYLFPFVGKFKDCRVYNRILTDTEHAALNSGGAYSNVVTSGLVFQGPVIRTNELTAFTDLTLTASKKLIDNIYGAIGIPNGSPISRLS